MLQLLVPIIAHTAIANLLTSNSNSSDNSQPTQLLHENDVQSLICLMKEARANGADSFEIEMDANSVDASSFGIKLPIEGIDIQLGTSSSHQQSGRMKLTIDFKQPAIIDDIFKVEDLHRSGLLSREERDNKLYTLNERWKGNN